MPAISRSVQITNKRGLHARASAKFVTLASSQTVEVLVIKDGPAVTGTSIMGLMMLAAGPGTKITIEAMGKEAAEVIEALTTLVTGKFTEGE